MASNNRATLIAKVLKILKRHYQPADTSNDRSLLEHLLFACCLENSLHANANEVFEVLTKDYFDWNEVRVSSVHELTTAMKPLNDPKESAIRLKRVLQSVFETHYTFDLESMKKQNIGQTVKQLEQYNGTTQFTVAFVTQNALSGHSIPINRGLLESMRVVGVVSDAEALKGTVPGLGRAVPKTKGVEVSTVLHQMGVELYRSPYGPGIRKLLLEIRPDCKDRLPKRPSKKVEAPAKPKQAVTEKSVKEKTAAVAKAASKATPPKKKAAKQAVSRSIAKQATKKKAAPKKLPAKKTTAKKTTAKRTTAKKTSSKKKPVKTTTKKKIVKKKAKAPAKGKKKLATTKLRKRKPK